MQSRPTRMPLNLRSTSTCLWTGEQKENPPQQPQSEVDAAVERIRRKLESMPTEQREALMNLIEKM